MTLVRIRAAARLSLLSLPLACLLLGSGCASSATATAAGSESFVNWAPAPMPEAARQSLQKLKEGNARFVQGKAQHPATDAATMEAAAEHGQHPFAMVLSCSDSRVPVERVFDRGVGEIFVVRVAGNIAGPTLVGSLEYGTLKLKAPLIVVLGHTECGAVQAACGGARITPGIDAILAEISPSVEFVKSHPHQGTLEEAVTEENVRHTLWELTHDSPTLAAAVRDGTIGLQGGIVDIRTGAIRWLE
ncbi:MAG: carbonic anhydrase [Phycisphaerales bacterium]